MYTVDDKASKQKIIRHDAQVISKSYPIHTDVMPKNLQSIPEKSVKCRQNPQTGPNRLQRILKNAKTIPKSASRRARNHLP